MFRLPTFKAATFGILALTLGTLASAAPASAQLFFPGFPQPYYQPEPQYAPVYRDGYQDEDRPRYRRYQNERPYYRPRYRRVAHCRIFKHRVQGRHGPYMVSRRVCR